MTAWNVNRYKELVDNSEIPVYSSCKVNETAMRRENISRDNQEERIVCGVSLQHGSF